MKRILIPTDFSLNSQQTINYVTELFKNETCAFYFLHTYTYDTGGLNAIEMLQADEEWFEKPKENSLKQLGHLLEKYAVRKNDSKHEFHAITEYSSLVKGIEKNLEVLRIDLIVLTAETKIGKRIEDVLDKIRTCPILIVPPSVSINKILNFTIASTFKQEVRTIEMDRFLESLNNTNFQVNILVLEEKKVIIIDAIKNLKLLVNHLETSLSKPVGIEYVDKTRYLKENTTSRLNSIMCILDIKPNFLRRLGLSKSPVISTLMKLHNSPVLTIHQ